jgi:hypothetical protein
MTYDLRIIEVKQQTLIADNSEFIDVEVEIFSTQTVKGKEKEVVEETRKFGFPLGTPEEEIQTELSRFLITFTGEKESAVIDAARAQEQEAATETITKLTGKEITYADASKAKARKAR